ncbi:non-homologous end-joining DNA ligase [Rhizobium laguerreae]|uniref:non-homologous end-joining DNA ligase n=1 Tax=Rhizobium laguerreae TaxID=1076926 RepID=UPI001E5E253C|nr:non-homologous end-joining DNA ligase [Rhizobium laguerreae]UFW65770.1 non-homologous end-joining DNA ligase [Rhizobium laguerreae]
MVKRPSKSSKPLLREVETPLKGSRRRRRNPEQPALPFDPMPDRIEPCLALLKPAPPNGHDWIFEIKWDGYRLSVHLDHGTVRIITRGGHDWTHRFPTIQAAAKVLPVGTAILDGEAVVLDAMGRSDFSALQQALGGRIGKRSAEEAIFVAFDLLYFDGHDLRNLEQESRRHLLEDLIPAEADGGIRLSQEIEGDGPAVLAAACEHGLEGIIAKRRAEPYRSGRGGEWIKVKCIQSDGFIILGFEPGSGYGGIGRLLMAAMREGKLQYVGGVGTGLSSRSAAILRTEIDKIVTKKPAASTGRKREAVWLKPVLVAEVEYRGWTGDQKLRHASYKGLRDPDENGEVFQLRGDRG